MLVLEDRFFSQSVKTAPRQDLRGSSKPVIYAMTRRLWFQVRGYSKDGIPKPVGQGETEFGDGGREGIRTLDLSVANAALSQLSYAPDSRRQLDDLAANPALASIA
jgi:hypothetical protein